MKPENKFRKWFLEEFNRYMKRERPGTLITVQKHADYATDGIADIDLSINGMTCWLEVKLLTSLKEERRLHVTPLQRAFLEGHAKGGVPSGLLVGLALGPRKGYDVALFVPPISEVAHRDMFRQPTIAMERIYAMAEQAAFTTHSLFETNKLASPPLVDHARLDVSDLRGRECRDEADPDGG